MQKYLENFDKIYCFNYTPTLETIYGIEKEKIIYIHGKLVKNTVNGNELIQYGSIVLGCDSEKYPELMTKIGIEYSKIEENPRNKTIDKGLMTLVKYGNSHEANSHTEQYKKSIESLKREFKHININYSTNGNHIRSAAVKNLEYYNKCHIDIFGHSLGKSDKRFVDIVKSGIENNIPINKNGIKFSSRKKQPRLRISYYTENRNLGMMPRNIQKYLELNDFETDEVRNVLVPINEMIKSRISYNN